MEDRDTPEPKKYDTIGQFPKYEERVTKQMNKIKKIRNFVKRIELSPVNQNGSMDLERENGIKNYIDYARKNRLEEQ